MTIEKRCADNGTTECQVADPSPSIQISIDAKGLITVETVGTEGKQCDLLAGALEKSLGRVESRINKETYGNESE